MTPRGRVDRAAEAVGRWASLAFPVIVAITAYEVVMRYALGDPTVWVHEITVTLAALAFVLGGPAVHASRTHIAITALHDRLPERWRLRMRLLHSAATLVFLAFLTYAAADQAFVSFRDMETSGTALNLPTPVLLKTVFALAAAVLLLQTLGHLAADLESLRESRARS